MVRVLHPLGTHLADFSLDWVLEVLRVLAIVGARQSLTEHMPRQGVGGTQQACNRREALFGVT